MVYVTTILNQNSSRKTNERRDEQQKMSSTRRTLSKKINPAASCKLQEIKMKRKEIDKQKRPNSLVTSQLNHPLFLECHPRENQRHLWSLASVNSKRLLN